jgi:hypothetical protein
MARLCAGVFAISLVCGPAFAASGLTPADEASAFKAAGFKHVNGQWTRCEDDTAESKTPGFIELEDLNGDGAKEAWVRESSTYCYGDTAEAFVLLTRKAGGWTVILDEVGIATALDTRHGGWRDIEVGGPGFGPMPVFQFNRTKYVSR